jgi:hypothetical protein
MESGQIMREAEYAQSSTPSVTPDGLVWVKPLTAAAMEKFRAAKANGELDISKKSYTQPTFERIARELRDAFPGQPITAWKVADKFDNERRRYRAWKAASSFTGTTYDPETGKIFCSDEQRSRIIAQHPKHRWLFLPDGIGNLPTYQEVFIAKRAAGEATQAVNAGHAASEPDSPAAYKLSQPEAEELSRSNASLSSFSTSDSEAHQPPDLTIALGRIAEALTTRFNQSTSDIERAVKELHHFHGRFSNKEIFALSRYFAADPNRAAVWLGFSAIGDMEFRADYLRDLIERNNIE